MMPQESAPLSGAQLTRGDDCWIGRFDAMACPCEILLDTPDASIAAAQLNAAVREAERIEAKYSRYRRGNIVERINTAAGAPVEVDDETASLLDYAAQCHAMSSGLFDITTGILRRAWTFDGTEQSIDKKRLAEARARVGWENVKWERPQLTIPAGFEIDFGGICKEYAADKILALLTAQQPISTLVNLGGDIAVAGPRLWSVGIEDIAQPGRVAYTVQLRTGGVATSGTTKRFVKMNGETRGHILNPKTGSPVENAPASVTVAAKTCTEAGFWSTVAILQGERAEAFLREQALEFWSYR